MVRRRPARLAVLSMLAYAAIVVEEAPAVHAANAVEDLAGCTAITHPRNDDEYTASVPLGFDFFFGNEFFSSLHISNNGYVTFGTQTPLWWMLRNWELFNVPLIALFHNDVDTRAPGSSEVTYGPILYGADNDGNPRPALCVNWVNVGHFDRRDDRLNSFQLILVGRGDRAPGDVDVQMNYNRIEWDNPGLNIATRAGIYDGTAVVMELPGSGTFNNLADGGATALTGRGAGSPEIGRYVTEMRGGQPRETAIVTGTVIDTNGVPVASSPVQACDTCIGVSACVAGTTDSFGHYDLSGFAQEDIEACSVWRVSVSPANPDLIADTLDVAFTSSDQIVTEADLVLDFPERVPSDTTITPSRGGGTGVPTVYWQEPLTLTTTGCGSVLGLSEPIATYMITSDGNNDPGRCDHEAPDPVTRLPRCGSMTETPRRSGIYVATVPPLAPAHGRVTVAMTLTCPDVDPDDNVPPLTGTSSFDMYIDPSGFVLTTHNVPIAGARVTLLRSESPLGPFRSVPHGSALMSPKNRTNPDFTDNAGHFGWDTVAGFYVVRADFPGCVSPGNLAQTFVDTEVLPVPPEWTDLHLFLDCEAITPPELALPPQVVADARTTAETLVTYQVTARDGRDGVVAADCSPGSGGLFPIGRSMVQCSANDSSGNAVRGSFPVLVSYAWSNVLPPLSPDGENRVPRGTTLPVKFALTRGSAGITELVAQLYVARVIDGVPGAESPASSPGGAPPRFRYRPDERAYVFNWSTSGLPAGNYQLRIDFGDGVMRTTPVTLR